MDWTRARFEIDGLGTYEGYHRGDSWNGWACPAFERAEAERIAADFHAQLTPNGLFEAGYDTDADSFYFLDPDDDPNEGPIHFAAETIDVGGVRTRVYPVGARYWTWWEVDRD